MSLTAAALTAAPPHTFSTTDGHDVDMLTTVPGCTVEQAAQFLDVSEGYVHEMLNAGRVLFRRENGERLIEWDSLRDYGKERKRKLAAFAKMVRMNQEMGLYDD